MAVCREVLAPGQQFEISQVPTLSKLTNFIEGNTATQYPI